MLTHWWLCMDSSYWAPQLSRIANQRILHEVIKFRFSITWNYIQRPKTLWRYQHPAFRHTEGEPWKYSICIRGRKECRVEPWIRCYSSRSEVRTTRDEMIVRKLYHRETMSRIKHRAVFEKWQCLVQMLPFILSLIFIAIISIILGILYLK